MVGVSRITSRATPEQESLLRAALLTGDDALASWERWKRSVDLDSTDRASTRLLPLLWHNLLAHGVTDRDMPRLKGVYRYTWFANQLLLRELRLIQQAFRDAGIECLVLKGIALAVTHYPNPGLRPMDDIDLLVRPEDVDRAVAALPRAGWTSPLRRPDLFLRVAHATAFRDSKGREVDLHAHLLAGTMDTELDRQRWARSVTVGRPDTPVRTLDTTDQLLHVLVHGAESDPPAIRWMADAMMILHTGGAQLDWERLLADAEREDRSVAVAETLAQLEHVFNAPVPTAVRRALASARPRLVRRLGQRLEHRIVVSREVPVVGGVLKRYVHFRRYRRTNRERPMSLARYLQHTWDLPRTGDVPLHALRRGVGRIRRDAGRLVPARSAAQNTSQARPGPGWR